MTDTRVHTATTDSRRSRLETQIKESQEKIEKKKTEIIQLQASAQGQAGQGQA